MLHLFTQLIRTGLNSGKKFLNKNRVVLLLLVFSFSTPTVANSVPVIAAASDLKFALEEVSRQFSQETDLKLKLSFGSSGNFYQQIKQAAPFELFMSADENYIFKLEKQGVTLDKGVLYALGRLVLFAPAGSNLTVDSELIGLKQSLENGELKHFAIANPELAPYGRAAKETLQTMGLWDAIQKKLILGENVVQTAQFASSGASDGGIFAYSLVVAPQFKAQGKFVLLSEKLHAPLRQRMVLLKSAGTTAQVFYQYLQQVKARAIFERYGFVLPQP